MLLRSSADMAEKGLAEQYEMRVVSVILPLSRSSSTSSNGTCTTYATARTYFTDDKSNGATSRPTSKLSTKTTRISVAAGLPERLPPRKLVKRHNPWIRFHLWFNTYRKFYIVVVTCNITALLLAIAGIWKYPQEHTGAFVLGNILFAILTRNELFGRLLYLFVNVFFAKWPPLKFRLVCTSILQHLGGIHSGCATSGFGWLIYRLVMMFSNPKETHVSVLITGIVTSIAVGISIISAFPCVRNSHHNVFEKHHRFVGWLGLVSTWVFVIIGDTYDANTRSWNMGGSRLVGQQDFWFAFGMTTFVLIPWITVRKVPVQVEIPSPKVAILRFERGMQQGLLARISRNCILEYHAFGIVSEGMQSNAHYLICGVQGDFTRGLVENPPTYIWTRELKFAGVSHSSTLYKRGIRVCTGTGLGAALSTCLQVHLFLSLGIGQLPFSLQPAIPSKCRYDRYLIWIGSDQEKTFGRTITGLIHKHLGTERCLLWDSKKMGGRPDVMQLIKDAYASWKAEVVFITSNEKGNQEMMEGCMEAGIPAFGTLWDF
ncbi:hypothetical protein AX17_004506 [Amanita inopinata Kibby_2008]|nr:hypothetical protein AX17_004506 [Amanita inopinata Kibby_2008]